MKPKKVKRRVGDIVKVDLGNQSFCFGRVLDEPLLAFYDLKTDKVMEIDDITRRPLLFKIWVMNHAITSGRWEVIGHRELEGFLTEPTIFFKQDMMSKELSLYVAGEEHPATRQQCKGLERAAVWDPEHVEDRLRDHYLGVSNKWVESMKLT